jgi:hypothetical protein
MTLTANRQTEIKKSNPGSCFLLVRRFNGRVLAMGADRKVLEEEAARIRSLGRGYSFATDIVRA